MAKEQLEVREGSVVSLKRTGCCHSLSHSGYGVVYNWGRVHAGIFTPNIFNVRQGGQTDKIDCHNIGCIEKVIRY